MTTQGIPTVNLLVSGPPGSGKTRLARMLSEVWRDFGMTVVSEPARQLLHGLAGARADQKLRELANADVRVIDGLEPEELMRSPGMLATLDGRGEGRPTIITTTTDPEGWHEFLAGPANSGLRRFLEAACPMELLAR